MAKCVIKKSGSESYLDKNGNYGIYENAKRFTNPDAAVAFASENHVPDTYGIFPCSVERNNAAIAHFEKTGGITDGKNRLPGLLLSTSQADYRENGGPDSDFGQ